MEANADVNQPTKVGTTPLIMAAWKGHLEAVRVLLAAGADLTPRHRDGTAMECARKKGHDDICGGETRHLCTMYSINV